VNSKKREMEKKIFHDGGANEERKKGQWSRERARTSGEGVNKKKKKNRGLKEQGEVAREKELSGKKKKITEREKRPLPTTLAWKALNSSREGGEGMFKKGGKTLRGEVI